MLQSMRSLFTYTLAIGVLVAGLPLAAAAAPEVIATSPLPISAVSSSNGRFVAWQAQVGYGPITVVDRDGGAPVTYDLLALRPPDVVANWVGNTFGISDDGRFLTYSVRLQSTIETFDTIARLDRTTNEHVVLFSTRRQPTNAPATRYGYTTNGLVSRDGQVFTWVALTPDGIARVMVRLASETAAREVGTTCVVPTGIARTEICGSAVSGDGTTVLYGAGETFPGALAYYEVATGAKAYSAEVAPWPAAPGLVPTRDASSVVIPAAVRYGTGVIFERDGPRVDPLTESAPTHVPVMLSDDGRTLLLNTHDQTRGAILDRTSGLRFALPTGERGIAISSDGKEVLVLRRDLDAQAFVLLVRPLDEDEDGMLDGWETFFGLDPTDPADAATDANGDGQTNLATFLERGHPTAVASATRLFAEGAAGSFFDTTVSLFNPGPDPALVVMRFLGSVPGTSVSKTLTLPSQQRTDLASCCLSAASPGEFGIIIESTHPVVAERRMSWDRVIGFGSHASTAVAAPATTWYFAEGATIAGFQTFLLLQNPGSDEAGVSIDYLLPDGTTVRRTHSVAPFSRYTVWANQEGAPLDAAEFAATVTASQPIVAERAMYRPSGGQAFGAGSNAIGVTTPTTAWSFAEGATGDFFDTFILVANTADTPGTVTAEFRAAGGDGLPITITRAYSVAARSRLTIWIDQEDPQLASTAVSTVITADVPVVAERSMWWPGTAETWAESHTEFGAIESGVRWAVADAELNPVNGTDTFVLVNADTGGTDATARVVVYLSDGGPITREVPLVAGRNTLWMAALFPEVNGQRFAVTVESLDRPGGPAPLTVEKAIYSQWFEAGAASLATRLPDPD